jgi:hypothetical protein
MAIHLDYRFLPDLELVVAGSDNTPMSFWQFIYLLNRKKFLLLVLPVLPLYDSKDEQMNCHYQYLFWTQDW